MTGMLASLLGLALLDSINPSALAVTIYLLLQGGSYASKVLTYLGAVFTSYLSIGVLLMLSLGSVSEYVDGPGAYVVQGIIGALLLGYAFFAPDKPRREGRTRTPRSRSLGAIFLLGVSITVVEFSSAFPYLGAIAILTNADLTAVLWVPILVGYNLIFVLPPFLCMVLYGAFGPWLRGRFERFVERLGKSSRETLLWITGLVGFFLLADSLAYFEFFGLVEVPEALDLSTGNASCSSTCCVAIAHELTVIHDDCENVARVTPDLTLA